MSSLDPLERLLNLNTSLPEFNDQISNILHGEEYGQLAKRISGTDALRLVDFLDGALDALDPASPGFRRCLRELRNICGARMILPTLYTPPSQVLTIGRHPVASGGSGDVFEGTLNRAKVCVKRVRVYSWDGPEVARKMLYQEAIMWKRLNHKNIVPLLAITTTPLQLISEWMSGGHLTEYIGNHPNANRLHLVYDIAEGLYYLHSRTIVHGNLKGPNILVDDAGRARITDVGLARVTQNLDSVRSASDEHGHTARWTAPEILMEQGSHSKEADIFSFSMVMIEAFTGAVPFDHSPPAAAIVAILRGVRPPRPTHPNFTSELWVLMQRCWNRDPYSRPEVSEILRALGITPPPTNPYSNGITASALAIAADGETRQSSLGPLEQLLHLDSSLSEFNDQVSNLLHGEEYRQWAQHINGADVLELVEFLDRVLDVLDPAGSGFRRCMRELRHICGARMTLPTSYTLTSQVLTVGHQPFASGGSGDVYEGMLNDSKVCVKRVRVYSRDGPEEATRTLYKEAIMWTRLKHKAIVPFLGITADPFQLVSEWMPGGNLTEYIRKYPDADLLGLVCDIAEGIYYLHSRNVVHGDLKGPNILADDTGRARITDFGLTTVTQNIDSVRSRSDERGHTARWTAPEILSEVGTYSKEADVFSYAMVMIEVFTGAIPFNLSPPAAAMIAIMNGTRPPRPTNPKLTDGLWELTQRCWDHNPHSRPEVSEVLKVLGIADPLPINPDFKRTRSSSTTTISRNPSLSGLPRTAKRFLSLNTTSATRPTPQISSQWSDHNSPASPEDRVGGLGMHESQGPGSHVSHQPALQPLPYGAYHRRPSQQRTKPNGRMQSRQNTEASEVSPVVVDPGVYDQNEQQQRRVDQFHGHGSGAGHSRPDLQRTLSSRNGSRRHVGGQGSRHDLTIPYLDDNDEGRYWSEGRRHNRGASRSALSVGDMHTRGGPSRNPSRPDLLSNASRDRLAQFGQSKTNLGRRASLNLVDTDGWSLSEQPSKKEPPRPDGYATGNPSDYQLTTRGKSRKPSLDAAGAPSLARPAVFEGQEMPTNKRFCCF